MVDDDDDDDDEKPIKTPISHNAAPLVFPAALKPAQL